MHTSEQTSRQAADSPEGRDPETAARTGRSRIALLVLAVASLTCTTCSRFGGAPMSEEEQAAQGRALYEANGCATCHGPEGRGDGPVAKATGSAPRDFRDAAGFVNGYEVEQISGTLQTGLTENMRIMPAYAHLSAADRRLLAVFVRSLRTDSKEEKP